MSLHRLCCCTPATVCDVCIGSMPASLEVTLAGLTNCQVCHGAADNRSYTTIDLNGTYTAAKVGDCAYQVNIATLNAFTYAPLFGVSCVTPAGTSDVYINITFGSSKVIITVGIGSPGATDFFRGESTIASPPIDCLTETYTISNTTSCPGDGASGGTAYISP